MTETGFTTGVELALHAAADFALQCGSAEIEPIHLAYGIVSFEERRRSAAAKLTAEQIESANSDWTRLVAELQRIGTDPVSLRGEIRKKCPSVPRDSAERKRMHRSARTRSIFERATEAGNRSQISPLDLLRTLARDESASGLSDVVSARPRFDSQMETASVEVTVCEASGDLPQDFEVSFSFDATKGLVADESQNYAARFSMLCESTWQDGLNGNIPTLLDSVVQRLLSVIKGADSAAVVEFEKQQRLLLKAHAPATIPDISRTLLNRAISQKSAFTWERKEQDLSKSLAHGQWTAGMYAPLLGATGVLGVICLHSHRAQHVFTSGDLQLLVAVAHQLSQALTNYQLQQDLRESNAILERLLTNFAPRTRTHLVELARRGKLKLGGQRSNVTILVSDIRGFTKKAARMDTEDVVDMLNEYFGPLAERIFRHDGTIDKFIGDAILAVFGSPQEDQDHCEHAVLAALDMQDCIRDVNRRRQEDGLELCELGIGIHTGEVVHGFIGSKHRMEFTVIGDAVNMASRFCDAASSSEIIVSPAVHELVWSKVEAAPVEISTKHEGNLQGYRVRNRRPS